MVHGTQCICEICTCGRHQCPSDAALLHHHQHHQNRQQQQHDGIIGGGAENAEGHFYRKEFATVGNIAERATPTRPKDELSLPQGPFAQREAAAVGTAQRQPNNARSTFVTSAALRRRANQSQIDIGGTATDGGSSAMRSTYREQSERALERGTNGTTPGAAARDSRRAIRAAAENGRQGAPALFGNGTTISPANATTINRTEYGQKVAERAQTIRPKTSDLWKRDGKIESQTVSRAEFGGKGRPERASPFRPRENGPLLERSGDDEFQRETSNLRDFGPKRAERAEARRPMDSDMFKSEEPLERRRDDYGQQGKGDRFEAKPHESSEIWRHNGAGGVPFEGRGVNAEEYGRGGAGARAERYATVRPKESDILKGHGSFARESHQRAEFGPKRAERAEAKKPSDSDIFRREGRNETESVSRTAFKGAGGERAEAIRPTESHILRGEGKLATETVARADYGQKGRGDRFPAKKHAEAELWHREGTMGAEGSVNRSDYAIDGKRGERHEISWAKAREASAPLFDPDLDPNQPHATTVHRTEFVAREGVERAQRKVPTEEGADLFRGDGTFMSETSKSADYQPKRGDRFEAKRHQPSDIWKHEGPIEGTTVNRADYSHVRGERAQPTRPTESDILKGHGSFARESHQRAEFGPKRAERAEAKKPSDSDIFKREGTVGELGTVNRTDFVPHQGRGERYERRVPPESHILAPEPGALAPASTVSRDEYGEKRAERTQRHRPPEAQFRLDQGAWEGHPALEYYTTVSQEDFGEKKAGAAASGGDSDAWSGGITAAERAARNVGGSEPNLLHSELDMDRWAREYGTHTHSQEQFGPKEAYERMVPVPHGSQFSITEPGATFDKNTMYSDHFQVSPESFTRIDRPQQIRPSTALRLSGNMDMVTGYRTEFQNKVKPCPAGELVESLKKEDKSDTEHFQFHTINKGHRHYKSKENLATLSAGEEEQ
ncbi:hypothetical protein niasHS_012792 [Heterodera schachtii]|uniref:Uncharacterized protein n=1 Tax=Heterodera schachtii TaxID=97005 RepID=A0ABD2ILR3_HETSC